MKYSKKKIQSLVFDWLQTQYNEPDQNKISSENCRYSLIENYIPDCPGWCGDVLTVIFGTTEACYVFTIDKYVAPQNKIRLHLELLSDL